MQTIEEYLMDPGSHPPFEIDIYLNGDCDLFATAVHRLTGWQIAVIVEPRTIAKGHDERLGLVHAFCIKDDNLSQIFDAKGWRDANSLNKEYMLHNECSVQFMTEDELFSLVDPIQSLNERRLMETIEFVQRYYKHFL